MIGSEVRDIVWLQTDGTEMSAEGWQQDFALALAVFLSGERLSEVDARGRPVQDDNFLLMFNAAAEGVVFNLPPSLVSVTGELLIDTSRDGDALPGVMVDPALPFTLAGRALALIRFARKVA